MDINYCIICGGSTRYGIPLGDTKKRATCIDCGHVHYQNPLVVVECIPNCDGRILLCKRNISPRKGFWTLPGGFMEKGESLEGCAIRETWEEARATVTITGLQGIYSTTFNDQVHVVFRADLVNNAYYPGEESQEVKLFNWHDLPWKDLAFEVTKEALEVYCTLEPKFMNACKTIDAAYIRNQS